MKFAIIKPAEQLVQPGILIAAIIVAQPASSADMDDIVCHSRKPSQAREWWSYRIVDGRRCWFRGHASMPKARLRWEHIDDERPIPMADDRDRGSTARPVAEPISVTTIRLRPGTAFEWHWRGLMIDFNARAWMDPMRIEEWHVF